jgi:putative endonuclease
MSGGGEPAEARLAPHGPGAALGDVGRFRPSASLRSAGRTARLAGLAAEDIALRLYGGARLMETRWRCPEGEIDLILGSPGGVVFVEVKARRSHAEAAAALSRRQRDRLGAAAARYLAETDGAALDARFDVVLVDRSGRAERIENAFFCEAA